MRKRYAVRFLSVLLFVKRSALRYVTDIYVKYNLNFMYRVMMSNVRFVARGAVYNKKAP
jgi:hypothetical protein